MKPTSIKFNSDLKTLSLLSQPQGQTAQSPFGKYIENISGVSLEMVRVPQGTFIMGNNISPNPEEKHAHQVNIKSFFIGQYEITRQQWNVVAATLPQIRFPLRQQYIGPLRGTF